MNQEDNTNTFRWATIDSSCDGTRARVERRASIPARAIAIVIVHLWCA